MKKFKTFIIIVFIVCISVLSININFDKITNRCLLQVQTNVRFSYSYYMRNRENLDYSEIKQIMFLVSESINSEYSPLIKTNKYYLLKDFDRGFSIIAPTGLSNENIVSFFEILYDVLLKLNELFDENTVNNITDEDYTYISSKMEELIKIVNNGKR